MSSPAVLDAAKARRQADSLLVEVRTLRANLEEECRISAKLQAELDRLKRCSPSGRRTPADSKSSLNGLVVYYPDACRKATGLTTGLLYMLEHHNVTFETMTPEVRRCSLAAASLPAFPSVSLADACTSSRPITDTLTPLRSCHRMRTRASRRRW